MSQLIALGLITAASALYGFVIAHYALGRSLRQRRSYWRVEQLSLANRVKKMT